MLDSKHSQYLEELHGLIPDGQGSFRNNDILDKQYNNLRGQYWNRRAKEILEERGLTVKEYRELMNNSGR